MTIPNFFVQFFQISFALFFAHQNTIQCIEVVKMLYKSVLYIL